VGKACAPGHRPRCRPQYRTSRNGALARPSAADTHGTVSTGVSHTAGRERSAARAAAFVPSDLAISSGRPPSESSRGRTSSQTQPSTCGSKGFGGSVDHECRCTVAPRRSATSPAYMGSGAPGPYSRPGITTASAMPATLRHPARSGGE
jgi:hypothetical protein